MSGQDYISISEASSLFGVHQETLRRWDRSGKLKALQVGPRGHRKYRRSEIEAFVRNEHKDFYQLHLQFQNYMLDQGYAIRKRESLLSPVFATTFTPSGGPDLVKEFSSSKPIENAIINQPCIRHWDIESVGDNKHLSFFNMFVAVSGEKGFSRTEAIGHFFTFFTRYLHLDPERMYASYCGGGQLDGITIPPDIRMQETWDAIGIPRERQFCFGAKLLMEAFVANSVEPYGGYRGELFYDMRENRDVPISSIDQFLALDKAGELLEFFTHVEYSYEVVEGKIGKAVPHPVVASGIGPQRVLKILEGETRIGNISVLRSLRSTIASQAKNLSEQDIDILVDHIRAIVFLFNDGADNLSGRHNSSRRSVLNKYLKRVRGVLTVLTPKQQKQLLETASSKAIDLFSILFPEFEKKRVLIIQNVSRSVLSKDG